MPTETNVNVAFYVQVLTRLPNRVTRLRSAVTKNWQLHQDNAPCHSAIVVRQLLAKFGFATFRHPLYSPDLASPDFSYFHK